MHFPEGGTTVPGPPRKKWNGADCDKNEDCEHNNCVFGAWPVGTCSYNPNS